MNFSVIFRDVSSTVVGQKFCTMHFAVFQKQKCFILKYDRLSLILAISENEGTYSTDFVKAVYSGENQIKGGVKIVSNGNVVLLLDDDGNLWQLINTFFKEKQLDSVKKTSFYEWKSFAVLGLQKVLQITAFKKGFACIGLSENSEKKLKVLLQPHSETLFDHARIQDLSLSCNYFLESFKLNIHNSIFKDQLNWMNEVLLISNRSTGKTEVFSENGKICRSYVSNIPLLAVINFEQVKCFALCHENGQIIFTLYENSSNIVSDCIAYLPSKPILVEKCYCSKSCVLWSNGVNLHHSYIKFDFSKFYYVNLTDSDVHSKVKGVMSILPTEGGSFLGVTINSIFYQIVIKNKRNSKKMEVTTPEVISQIHQSSKIISDLNKWIMLKVEFLSACDLRQRKVLNEGFKLFSEENWVILKNFSKYVFNKSFWKVGLKKAVQGEKLQLEIMDLKDNLNIESIVKFEKDMMFQLKVVLIGDFVKEFELVVVELGTSRKKEKVNDT